MATKRKTGADTVAKQPKKPNPIPNSKPFVKGDARINRLGRPHNFDELRALVQEIGAEKLDNSDLTRIAAKVRQMYASRQSGDNVTLLAYGFGKPKEEINATIDVKEPFNPDTARILFERRPSDDPSAPVENQSGVDGTALGKNDHGGDSVPGLL